MTKVLRWGIFTVAVCFLFFFYLGKIPLWSSDEGRYGEIAREMWETKNFIVPTFNYFEYLEKPVLTPLLASLSIGVFGTNAFAVRMIPVLSALLGILVTYFVTRRLFNARTAFFSILLLATTVGYVMVGRFAVIDMTMTMLLTFCMFCLLEGFLKQNRRCYLLAFVFMGLAFLTKGMIGFVLPGLIFLTFLIWTKNLKELKSFPFGWGILILIAIIGPWFYLISQKEPEFFRVFIVEQQFGRFLTGSFGRHKPFWFFVPILFATAFPWSMFLPAAIRSGLKGEPQAKLIAKFLITWIAVVFIFFTIPKSKLPYYLLPISVPMAILIGKFFAEWTQDAKPWSGWVRGGWYAFLIVAAGAVLGLNGFLFFGNYDSEIDKLREILHIATAFLAVLGTIAYFLACRGKRTAGVYVLAAMMFVAFVITFIGMRKITPYQSSYAFAELINRQITEDSLVAVYASPDEFSDFPFYLQKRIIVLGTDRGTLTHEYEESKHHHDLKKWFMKTGRFVEIFNEGKIPVYCLMLTEKRDAFLRDGYQNYHILKEDKYKTLIANVPAAGPSA